MKTTSKLVNGREFDAMRFLPEGSATKFVYAEKKKENILF